MKKMIALLSVMTVVVALTIPLVAQDHGEMPPEAMKAMMPGEHHEHLGTLAGEYTFSGSAWMKPGAEPTTFTGTRSARMILGGRFLEEKVESEFMGMPFEGMGLFAYDNTAERYIYMWMDNMSTAVATSYGSRHEDGWLLEGDHVDPATGKTSTFRNVIRSTDTGFVFEWYEDDYKTMEIKYTKK